MQTCLVNLAHLNVQANGGVSRVAHAVSLDLIRSAQADPTLQVILVVATCAMSSLTSWLGISTVKPCILVPFSSSTNLHWLIEQLKPDLIVSPLFGLEPFYQVNESIPHIVHMPDTLALDHPDALKAFDPERRLVYERLRQASHVVTISHYSASRLIKHLQLSESVITVIPLGANALLRNIGTLPRRLAQRPYILYPANLWLHKRHDLLFQVMRVIWKARPDLMLVLTGGREANTGVDLHQLIHKYRLSSDHIVDLGYVSNGTLQTLYSHAEAMLFVSAYEGFGMPILEAMYNACPVICAPVTAIPEIAGDAALYVDSDDPNEWAKAYLEQLPVIRNMLIERGLDRAVGYQWQRTCEQWRDVLEKYGLKFAPNTLPFHEPVISPVFSISNLLWQIRCNSTLRTAFKWVRRTYYSLHTRV